MAAPNPEAIRVGLYQVFGGLLLECPSAETLDGLRRSELLRKLGEGARDPTLAAALERMQSSLAGDVVEAVRADYAGLFLGVGKAKAPPWESVYRSPDRLVWQEPAREVLECYARARLGYDGMTEVPPDHVGRELLFVASLAALDGDVEQVVDEEGPALDEQAALAQQRSFLADHVLAWVPRFLGDVRQHAATEFFRSLADALAAHLVVDSAWLEVGQEAGTAAAATAAAATTAAATTAVE